MNWVDIGQKALPCSGAIAKYLRVKTPASLALAGATDKALGVLRDPSFAANDVRTVLLRSKPGTIPMIAAGVIAAGAYVYAAASGKVSATANGLREGIALSAATADGDVIEVVPIDDANGKLYTAVAASTALTASSTETAFSTGAVTIPAGTLQAGDVIRVRAQVIATATNSTDTLTVKLYLGGLTGTAIASTGALDATNNDIAWIDAEIVIRSAGATGKLIAAGTVTIGVEGTATLKAFKLAETAVDTTVAQDVTVSGQWSTTNGGNSCRLDLLTVQRIAA